MRVLYVTHYGILQPLGQTQVLPYLIGLAAKGVSIDILSFEKAHMLGNASIVEDQRTRLHSCDIRWFPRPYHRGDSPRRLLMDILVTAREIRVRCVRDRINLLHCRAHVPSWMAWSAAAGYGIPLLFDFRGFMAEEYVDSGLWSPGGFRFRLTKVLERAIAQRCPSMVVLTRAARDYLCQAYALNQDKLFVIPCCVDLARFQPAQMASPPNPRRPLRVVYSGSTVGRYRVKEMMDFFALLLAARPGSHLTVLSSSDPRRALEVVAGSALPPDSVTVESLSTAEVAGILSQQDLGLIFLGGGVALLAASPTKLGEYLASGLAVVAEERLGDIRQMLVEEQAGCLIDSGQPAAWPAVLENALQLCGQQSIRHSARRTAARYFSLAAGVDQYLRAYEYALNANQKLPAKPEA